MDQENINDLARKVAAGEIGVPYLDELYVPESQLIDLGLKNGWCMSRLSYCLENALLLPQKDGRLFHVGGVAQRLEFIRELEQAGFSLELQQVLMGDDHRLEQSLWECPDEALRRRQLKTKDPLRWALLHITHALTVAETMKDRRRQIVGQEFSDPALAREFRRLLQEAGRRRRERNRHLIELAKLVKRYG